ncbi:hypothetical protein DERP_014452 [Dermatophagoides pteronyssinus]|uniref:Uncharacterized protein n=1 Tax=Dermatophagoides pteronyssinus TaxID=6956 RepID=A0ABQ8IW45_DERPT|nr:hypothetical protein DERP_014452 [Dermatophagoides pteronyssinus]
MIRYFYPSMARIIIMMMLIKNCINFIKFINDDLDFTKQLCYGDTNLPANIGFSTNKLSQTIIMYNG